MAKKHLTYKQAGVDIKKADSLVGQIKKMVASTYRSEVLKDIGGFGGLFQFNKDNYKKPVLVSSSDGVGTKLKIATLANKHDTVGIDMVAMNVNDVLCCGAEPLFFLDYLGCSKLEPGVYKDIIKGIVKGCRDAGCALVGGETAEMPGMYQRGEYDLAGFCVGIVEKDGIIDGSGVKVGDAIIGLASNGLHSNGFSLVRRVFTKKELVLYAKELLKPTRIYVKPILSLLSTRDSLLSTSIKGIAHITGGAFYDKMRRIIPKGANFQIQKGSWRIPEIFKLIQNRGNIQDREMFHTFNMGVGMVVVAGPKFTEAIISKLAEFKLRSWVIGEVVRGKRQVEICS